MQMQKKSSSLMRQHTNRPVSTLIIIESDSQVVSHQSLSKASAEKEKKSVHFASDFEEVSDEGLSGYSELSSSDEQTLMVSEQLYSGDTFVSLSLNEETATEATSVDAMVTLQTDPSYGSSTFIPLDSSDESKTESYASFTDNNSVASSSVFSDSSATSDVESIQGHRKSRTEIVKDIEDLEESDFFSKTDLPSFTDATESEFDDSALAEENRKKYIAAAIKQLREIKSPKSFESDDYESPKALETQSCKQFCREMIKVCQKRGKSRPRVLTPRESQNHKHLKVNAEILEKFGLSSAVVERLRHENFQARLQQKIKDLDTDIQESTEFIQNHQSIVGDIERSKFISHVTRVVNRQNMEEIIQDHTLKMHPVLWFADFLQSLPHPRETPQHILDVYKKQIEDRQKLS